jgi:hypothetical protein
MQPTLFETDTSEPTLDEITAACAKIREGWDELEYRRRSIGSHANSLDGKQVTVLVYNMEPSGRKGGVTFSAQG